MKFLYPGGGASGMYGTITAPNHRGIPLEIRDGGLWAADLGCLQGPDYVKKIDFAKVAEWLKTMEPYRSNCLFLAGGDIVGNAEGTLETYEEFSRYFAGWPMAYVAQNGAENLPIPEGCKAVFIGGDTAWKESEKAISVIKRAQKKGLHIHIGRVNWGRRYRLFSILEGSENFTCDGTRCRYEGREKTISAWKELENTKHLFRI